MHQLKPALGGAGERAPMGLNETAVFFSQLKKQPDECVIYEEMNRHKVPALLGAGRFLEAPPATTSPLRATNKVSLTQWPPREEWGWGVGTE